MSAHTKGPWTAHEQEVRGPHEVTVAWCGEASVHGLSVSYVIRKDEAHANARLIAAAPDLLVALKALVPQPGVVVSTRDSIAQALAAIAKAEGK